jgi:hypothetical protein
MLMTEKTIKIETKINNTLFWICFFITIVAIVMAFLEFFARGGFPTSKIGLFYVGVLIIYSFHKEALRFLEQAYAERAQKKGELFVYLWIIIAAVLHFVNFLTKNYYSVGENGEKLLALANISYTALEVGAVFVLTRILKLVMTRFYYKNEKPR